MNATPRDWAMLIALGLIWGAAFPATSLAIADFPPMTLAAGRVAIGAVALSAVLLLRGEWLPPLSEHRFWLFALGGALVSNAIPFTLLAFAQSHVESSFAGVAVATVPLFVLPMAHFLVPGEPMTWRKSIGFSLGFIGIIFLIGPKALMNAGGGSLLLLAELACFGSAFCYAAGSIIAKLAPDHGVMRFGAAALILGALIAMVLAYLIEGFPAETPSASGMAGLIYLGLIPTGLAMVLLLIIVASAGPTFLSMVNYQVPVWAVLLSVIFLGESIGPNLIIALALIFGGLAISRGRLGLRRGGHARG